MDLRKSGRAPRSTGIRTRIPNEKLHPDDGGRGLGQRIQNLHDRLPAFRAERVEAIERAQRQLDAERARPVPAQFPRHAELTEARQRRDQLRAELMPPPPAADQSPAPAAEPLTADDVDEHPVYGQRRPSTVERHAWVAAYERYDPAVVFWGNRARGVDAWAATVNAYSLNPDNWHATRVHDIGHFHGVHLQARVSGDAMRIEPRHPYAKTATYPTFSAQPGQLDTAALSTWLRTQRNIATAERNALRHHPQAAHHPHISAPSHQR